MKTKITLLFLFSVFCLALHSQDIIVKKNGDTVRCKKITKIDSLYIYFDFKVRNGTASTFIKKDEINSYKIIEKKEWRPEKNEHLMALNFQGGYIIGNSPKSNIAKKFPGWIESSSATTEESFSTYLIQLEVFISKQLSLYFEIGSNEYKENSQNDVTTVTPINIGYSIGPNPVYLDQKFTTYSLNLKYSIPVGKFSPFFYGGVGIANGKISGYYSYYSLGAFSGLAYREDNLTGVPLQFGLGASYEINKNFGFIAQLNYRYIINNSEIKLGTGGFGAEDMSMGQLFPSVGIFLRY